jgi:hypothetical protein
MNTPDSPMVRRTLNCSLSDECRVSRSLGFGAIDHLSLLSSCGTGQSDVTVDTDCHLTSSTADCARSRAVDRWAKLTVAPLSHRTVRWHTGQSDEF